MAKKYNIIDCVCDLSKPKKWIRQGFSVEKYSDGEGGLIFTKRIYSKDINYTVPQFVGDNFKLKDVRIPIEVGGWTIEYIEIFTCTRNPQLNFHPLMSDGCMPCALIPESVLLQLSNELFRKKLIDSQKIYEE